MKALSTLGSLLSLVLVFHVSASFAQPIDTSPWQSVDVPNNPIESILSSNSYAENQKGRRTFVFDPRRLRWYAYDSNGRLLNKGRASGGRHYCPDTRSRCRTPRGSFSVYHKGTRHCKSSKFPIGRGGAPMPYCVFFHKGYAIHGSYDVPNYNASHGCIRVHPRAAAWLHRNFLRHGTKVVVRPY